jgi:dihydrofolate synthase/folylpolyglutamate synthase
LIVTEPDFRKKMDAARLGEIAAEVARESGHTPDIIVEPYWTSARKRLIGLTRPGDLAVVSGTLYLVSDVRSRLLDHSHFEKGW